jgi:hypothetical protein
MRARVDVMRERRKGDERNCGERGGEAARATSQ